MWKQHQVVMLTTNQKPTINSIVTRPSDNRMAQVNVLTIDDKQPCIHQHLYILSDDETKNGFNVSKGNWFYDTRDKVISNNSLAISQFSKLIIATTDSSLKYTDHRISPVPNFCDYPQIPQSFIQHYANQYNSGKAIDYVEVEYEQTHWKNTKASYEDKFKLKINNDNTINIKPIKDNWSREEVEGLIAKAYYKGRNDELVQLESNKAIFPEETVAELIEQNL